MGLGLADVLVPGVGRPVVEALKLICTAAGEMHESTKLCARTADELRFLYDKLEAMEQKGTLPSDDVVRTYSQLVGDYSVFLDKHRGKSWLYRVVTYKRVLATVADVQADTAALLRALSLCHMDAMADEVARMQAFRAQQTQFQQEQAHLVDE